jgi:hypothetical protein
MNYWQLLYKLYQIYDSLEGKVVDHKTILRRIKRAIPFTECKIVGYQTLSVATNSFDVSGMYDPEQDEFDICPIEIEIGFPKRKENFEFSEDDFSRLHWSNFILDFLSILGHEFVHLQQFRRRNFSWPRMYVSKNKNPRIKEQQEYFGDPDEIDAYAYSAALEMAVSNFTPNKVNAGTISKTRIYITYTKLFKKNDPIVLKLEKHTKRYYKKLEQQYHATTF